MIIGTAGHVDHGKTALVKALTGTDPDRLAEEKRRGITIDLGYAYAGDLGFIDVPGHERFVHTMLAGASGIDAALLVVALPEGVMPQTREHAAILALLGIERGIVALTKADIAADRIDAVTAQVRTLVPDWPIMAVSAVTGQGVAELDAALRGLGPRARPANQYPRLAVDRAFTLSGAGLVVTGTLVSGSIAVEDHLVLSPPGLELRVRGLHAQNKPAERAVAGQRVALNITGPRLSKDLVTRGDWVLHPVIHAPTSAVDARITLLEDAPRALRADTPVHLHLGAAHTMARAIPLDRERLEPGATTLVRLHLGTPIGGLAMDRLVLRDAGATRTIGGGVLLDPFPPKRGRRLPARLAQLQALAEPDPANALRALLALPPGWTDLPTFLRARNAIADTSGVLRQGDLAISQAAHDGVKAQVVATLAAFHADAPDQPGLQPERLRLSLPARPAVIPFRELVAALVAQAVIVRDGPWLRLPGHRVTLTPRDEALWRAARGLISAERFRPPRVRDLANTLNTPEPVMRAMLKRVQRMGQVVEIAQDHFFLRETVAEMIALAAGLEELTAATFRDRLDNGRKVAIQILEFLDKAGVTVRNGDVRRIRADRIGLFG